MERAVIGRIFHALPTQTDTTVAFIYKIDTTLLIINTLTGYQNYFLKMKRFQIGSNKNL
jgi:hypothetical protein